MPSPPSDQQPTEQSGAAKVTRIARRRALAGHEAAYEAMVEMFTLMAKHHGFLGANLIRPTEPGGDHQVVVHFASEADLAGWDASADRAAIIGRMRDHAVGEPEHRRLTGLEAWFSPDVVPASTHPPRQRMAFVTWLGIWPTASIAIRYLAPELSSWGLPFLAVTAINTMLITAAMTWLIMPRLTKTMRGFLRP